MPASPPLVLPEPRARPGAAAPVSAVRAEASRQSVVLATRRRQKRAAVGLPPASYAVLGELMLHRYPRTVAATAASVGVSKQTVYGTLARLERWARVPLVRQSSDEGVCVGIDWQALRGMA